MKISGKLIIIVIIVVIIGLIFAVQYKYISLEVVAIIAGPLAAIFTVSLEYIKDQREKLSDRKSLWLDKHWETIGKGMMNLYFENIIQTKLENWDNFPDNNRISNTRDKLDAFMVYYHLEINNETSFQIIVNNHENQYKYVYRDIIEHLRSGYKNSYNMFNNLINVENEYACCLEKLLNAIVKCIQTLMENNFPSLKMAYEERPNDKELEYYHLQKIFTNLIHNNPNNKKSQIVPIFEQNNSSSFIRFNKTDYSMGAVLYVKNNEGAEKFIKNVWNVLNNKFSNKIGNLEKRHEFVVSKENEFKESLKGIIDLYLLGYRLEGDCDMCKKVLHENDIEKLRPKL